jgi:hypothetical protein
MTLIVNRTVFNGDTARKYYIQIPRLQSLIHNNAFLLCSSFFNPYTGYLIKCEINNVNTNFVNKRENKVRQGYRYDNSKLLVV